MFAIIYKYFLLIYSIDNDPKNKQTKNNTDTDNQKKSEYLVRKSVYP